MDVSSPFLPSPSSPSSYSSTFQASLHPHSVSLLPAATGCRFTSSRFGAPKPNGIAVSTWHEPSDRHGSTWYGTDFSGPPGKPPAMATCFGLAGEGLGNVSLTIFAELLPAVGCSRLPYWLRLRRWRRRVMRRTGFMGQFETLRHAMPGSGAKAKRLWKMPKPVFPRSRSGTRPDRWGPHS